MRFKMTMLGGAVAIAMASAVVAFNVAPGSAATPPEFGLPAGAQSTEGDPSEMALAQADQAESTLPGGASALSETYQDWQVACAQQEAAKHCALSQSQVQQNGQRVLAIELAAPTETTVNGIVLLPFGLALTSGAVLQIDDEAAGSPCRSAPACRLAASYRSLLTPLPSPCCALVGRSKS